MVGVSATVAASAFAGQAGREPTAPRRSAHHSAWTEVRAVIGIILSLFLIISGENFYPCYKQTNSILCSYFQFFLPTFLPDG